MRIMIKPTKPGNRVNVRKAMTGKNNEVIVKTYADGAIIEDAKLSKDGKWWKVSGGYVRSDLAIDADLGVMI